MNNLSLLALLRQQTATLHRRVEQQSPMSQLLRTDIDDEEYLDTLYLLHDFVANAERSLQHHFGDGDSRDYFYIPRLGEIIRDIHQLQGITPSRDNQPLETCYYRSIGMAYVVEGSTAGGEILAKRLARQLQRDKHTGIGYFNFHRRGTWSLFQTWLDRVVLDETQKQRCVSGAKACFETLLAQRYSNHQRLSC